MNDSAPQALTDFALRRIHKLAHGNNVGADDIVLQDSTEASYSFPATITLAPHIDQNFQHVKGRPSLRSDYAVDTKTEMDNLAQMLRRDSDRIQQCLKIASDKVQQQDHYGWGCEQDRMALPELDIVLCCSEACGQCRGQAKQTCSSCGGRQNVTCNACHGSSNQRCTQCGGSGKMLNSGGEYQPCNLCHGRMTIPCRTCHGRGSRPCSHCNARGTIECKVCDGSGAMTHIITLNFSALVRFHPNENTYENLPRYIAETVKKIGIARLKDNLADIAILESTEQNSVLSIHYNAQFPFARATVKIKNKDFVFSIIGKKPVIYNMPCFLDHLAKDAVDELQKAGDNKDILRNLKAALDYAIVQAAMSKAKKPKDLCQFYGKAISFAAAQTIYLSLKKIVAKLSQMPRIAIGSAVIFFASIWFTLHFFVWRQNPWPFQLKDLKSLPIFLILQFIAIQVGGTIWLRQIFDTAGLHSMLGKKHIKSPFGKIGLAMLAGVVAAYGIIMFAAFLTGKFTL